jgi:hypothetical protein
MEGGIIAMIVVLSVFVPALAVGLFCCWRKVMRDRDWDAIARQDRY